MQIIVKTIPHKEQRYETPGDWWWEDDVLQIRVSELGNKHYEWFIAEHEINEALLCRRDGVSEKSASDFDKEFEDLRKLHPRIIGDQEPGNMVTAPYHKQHKAATDIENMTCAIFGEDWRDYDNKVNSL